MHTFSTSADEINNRRQSRHIVLLLFGKSPISFSAKNRICVCFFKKQPRVLVLTKYSAIMQWVDFFKLTRKDNALFSEG